MSLDGPLTPKEKRFLEFVVGYWGQFGTSPTYREIQEGLGFESPNSVRNYVLQLQKKGYLKVIPGQKRNLILGDKVSVGLGQFGAESVVSIPVVSEVSAGHGFLDSEPQGYVSLPSGLLSLSKGLLRLIAVKVRGESMRGEGIFPGDLLIIDPHVPISSGLIGILWIHDEGAVVKRVELAPQERVILMSAHSDYSPKILRESECRWLGKVIALIRNY